MKYLEMAEEYDNSAKVIKEKIDFYRKERKKSKNKEEYYSKITYYKHLYYDLIYTRNMLLKKGNKND